jgi:hypothetical protein
MSNPACPRVFRCAPQCRPVEKTRSFNPLGCWRRGLRCVAQQDFGRGLVGMQPNAACSKRPDRRAASLVHRVARRGHSGIPALRRPSFKCAPTSGRLHIFAMIAWSIVNPQRHENGRGAFCGIGGRPRLQTGTASPADTYVRAQSRPSACVETLVRLTWFVAGVRFD